MNNFHKAFFITAIGTIVSACTTDPSINNARLHANQAYQPVMAAKTSEKEYILGIVRNFATSVACSTSFDDSTEVKTTIDDVFLVGTSNLGSVGDQDFNSDYLVFWSGDMGCSGGVVDYTSFMTPVNKISDTRPFLIETDFGSEDIRHDTFFTDLGIYPRFISEVKYKNGIFNIIAGHDNNDGTNGWIGNTSPRYEYLYTVTGDVHEGWKVVNKKLLEDYKFSNKP